MFAKIFNVNTKKQLYLQRLEKLLHDELSIDYMFQEFRRMKMIIYKNIKANDLDIKYYFNPTKSTKGQSIHSNSIDNK